MNALSFRNLTYLNDSEHGNASCLAVGGFLIHGLRSVHISELRRNVDAPGRRGTVNPPTRMRSKVL